MTTRRALHRVSVVLAGILLAGLVPAVHAASDSVPPDVAAPEARLRSGGTVQSATVPFTLSWTASDPSGIARFRVQQQVDGGSWETIALPDGSTRSLSVELRPPHEYRFRVRARDGAGNSGADVAGPTFRVRRVSETNADVSTAGAWRLVSDTGFLGDRALRSGTAGATVTFSFTGSQVAWFGTRRSNRGKAEVFVDGFKVATVDLYRASAQYRRIVFRHAWPESGKHSITIRVLGTAGHPYVDVDGFAIVDPPAADPVLVGAGDIAWCTRTQDEATAKLLDGIAGRVFVAGDVAYPSGTAAQFRDCYDPTWGRWKLRTSPVPGNHEYLTEGAIPYFDYFGSRAGPRGEGWYAYNLGTWRIYNLNSNCTEVGCGASSEQVQWLEADLAANPRECVAAVWHHPLFSSGEHGDNPSVAELWKTLDAAGADVVLNGHDHDYERFAPLDAGGLADPNGIRQFIVGTGGATLRPFDSVAPNSVVREAGTYGVLKLTLRDGSYDWAFVPIAGQTFTDTGSAACH